MQDISASKYIDKRQRTMKWVVQVQKGNSDAVQLETGGSFVQLQCSAVTGQLK